MGNVSTKQTGAPAVAGQPSRKHTGIGPAQLSVTIDVQCYVSDDDEQQCAHSSLTKASNCSTEVTAWKDSRSWCSSRQVQKHDWTGIFKQLKKRSATYCDDGDAYSRPRCKTSPDNTCSSVDATFTRSSRIEASAFKAVSRLSSRYQHSLEWATNSAKSLKHSSRHLLPSCLKPQCNESHGDPLLADQTLEDETASCTQQAATLSDLAGQLEAAETTKCVQHSTCSPAAIQAQPLVAAAPHNSSTAPDLCTGAVPPSGPAPVATVQAAMPKTLAADVGSDSDSSTTTIGRTNGTAAAAATDGPQELSDTPASLSDSAPPQSWSFGSSSVQNARQHMEDRVVCCNLTGHKTFPGATRAGMFAVFDGHGGQAAAEYLSHNIVQHILTSHAEVLHSSPLEALSSAIQQAERHILETWDPQSGPASGSTLCLGLLVDDTLHLAHVGDSRAVMARGTKSVPLTCDHKPKCSIEAQRIATADPQAHVSTDGYLYELGVSRGLGSAHIKADPSKAAYVATPELASIQLDPADYFVTLATDGLWDKVGSADAVSAARRNLAECRDPAAASQALAERAQKLGSLDNISVITLLLHGRDIVLPKSNSRLFSRRVLQAPVEPCTPAGTEATGHTSWSL